MNTTSTIYVRTNDKRGMLIRVKREVTYTVPPAPSERVDKALAALKSKDAEYPGLARRRADLVQAYRHLTPEQQERVREELAELETEVDKE